MITTIFIPIPRLLIKSIAILNYPTNIFVLIFRNFQLNFLFLTIIQELDQVNALILLIHLDIIFFLPFKICN